MGKCKICKNDMSTGDGCIDHLIALKNGENISPVKHQPGNSLCDPDGERCGDCGTPPGEYHHANCDWARMDDGSQILRDSLDHWVPEEDPSPFAAESEFVFLIMETHEETETYDGYTTPVEAYNNYESAKTGLQERDEITDSNNSMFSYTINPIKVFE